MPRIISYSWTTQALLERVKNCTRRSWDDKYAASFNKGDVVEAWDRSPRYGGIKLGTIKLTAKPYQQNTSDMTMLDFKREGLAWMEAHGIQIKGKSPRQFFEDWKTSAEIVWVVEFGPMELLSFTEYKQLREKANGKAKVH